MILSQSKKTALFFLFVLFAGGLSYLLISGIDKAVDPVSLLPQNTALLIDVKKPAKALNKFRKSKFGVQVTSIKWQDVLQDIGIPEEDVQEILNLAAEIETIIKSPFFSEMFGQRVLLGLMPADPPEIALSSDSVGLEHMMVLIARPRHRASLVDFFAGFFFDELEHTTESYKGREIKTFVYNSSFSFSSTVTDGLVIASFSPELVKRCIDNSINNMTSGHSGLLGNIKYRQLKQKARGRDDQFVYIDIPRLQVMIENNMHAAGYPPHSGYHNGIFYGVEPTMQRIAFFRQPGSRTLKYSSIIQYNQDDERLSRTVFKQNSSARDSLLSLLPDNNVVHLWMNIFDAGRLWNFLRSESNISIQALVKKTEEWIINNTEYSIAELLSFFGSQVSVNVAEMRSSGVFPMPRISFFIEVRNREKLHDFLKKILADLQVRQSTAGSQKIFSIILAGGLMQPSYMFHDDFLIVADNRKQLENMLSLQKKSLLNNPLFKKVDVGLAEANNFVLYFRNAELIDGLKELVRWYGSLLQLFDSESEVKNRAILEEIVLPLLEGMKMYKVKT
ncbi:MAG: hypothetical protein OEM01_13955, partial [Desulfobulbaceae bacterium]|nr:hypothetical protein [Desulfobulbaceae bacterium]